MATKEDILEQIVEEYLLHLGYFARHNIKFLLRPDHPDYIGNQHSNHRDIDVLAYHPSRSGHERVIAVSCKSWQGGFNPASELRHIELGQVVRGREAWKSFRELIVPIWADAFTSKIRSETGHEEFTYILAVTHVVGSKEPWEGNANFREKLGGNPIRVLDLREMLGSIAPGLGTTLASTEVGRMLQLFAAAGIGI